MEGAGTTRWPRWLAVLLFIGAALSAVGSAAPLEWVQPLGSLLRRAEDVTPERYERLRRICGFFAVALVLSAGYCWWRAERLARRLQVLRGELRTPNAAGSEPSRLLPMSLVTAGGVWLRLLFLHGPMTYDEAYSFLQFARRPWYEAIADYSSTNNHLLNTLLMHWCYRIWGPQEWALRLPALVAGSLLPVAVFLWIKRLGGANAGLIAAALTAASPILIQYSVEARGYVLVTLFAVLLAACEHRVAAGTERPTWAGLLAWLWAVLGFWAMPIMVYPFVGVLAWHALEPVLARAPFRTVRRAVLWDARMSLAVGLAVAVLYAPALVYRGLLALQNPFVQPRPWNAWWNEYLTAWTDATLSWAEGPLGVVPLVALFGVGVMTGLGRRASGGRLLGLLLFTAILMALHRVAPPPRVFVFLAPAFYAVSACSVDLLASRLRRPGRVIGALAVGVLALTLVYARDRPVIQDPLNRTPYLSVPEAILRLEAEVHADGRRARLLAPLPFDFPSRFYMSRRGFEASINGMPATGETIWLLTLTGDQPEATLEDVAIRLSGWRDSLGPWRRIARFRTLDLYRSDARL